MADTVTPAGDFGLPIADRIALWLQENPDASEYCVNEEIEAKELLLGIAATIKAMMIDVKDRNDYAQVKAIRNAMCRAAAQSKAIPYIRELNKTDPLEFLGVRITVPEEIIH